MDANTVLPALDKQPHQPSNLRVFCPWLRGPRAPSRATVKLKMQFKMKTQLVSLAIWGISAQPESQTSQNAMENRLVYLGVSKKNKNQEDILLAHSNKEKIFLCLKNVTVQIMKNFVSFLVLKQALTIIHMFCKARLCWHWWAEARMCCSILCLAHVLPNTALFCVSEVWV